MDISKTKELTKLMHDFKYHGFNAPAIINEYNHGLSLRLEVADNERKTGTYMSRWQFIMMQFHHCSFR
jgi:hypothetical protein